MHRSSALSLGTRVTAKQPSFPTSACVFCQYRHASRAPATRKKQRAERPLVVTAAVVKHRESVAEERITRAPELINYVKAIHNDWPMYASKLLSTAGLVSSKHSSDLAQVLLAFHYDCIIRERLGWSTFREFYENRYSAYRIAYDYTDDELYEAALYLMNSQADTTYPPFAQALLFATSRSGHAESTIFLIHYFLQGEKRSNIQTSRQSVLGLPEVVVAQTRLAQLADEGNHRAMALRAHLALQRNQVNVAVKLLGEAIPGAVEAAKEKIDAKLHPMLAQRKYDDISTPWVELASLLYNQQQWRQLADVVDAGASVDDPTSFYQRALLGRSLEEQEIEERTRFRGGEVQERMAHATVYSLDWLHDMSRAAASGHVPAAVEMAQYYADTIPHARADNSWFPVRLAKGLGSFFSRPVLTRDTRAGMVDYAALIRPMQARIDMAFNWLEIATSYHYAPAYLRLARLHISKYIYPVLNLRMGVRHPDEQTREDHYSDDLFADLPRGIENPYYSPEKAHDCLASIFEMQQSVMEEEDKDPKARSGRASKWFKFDEVVTFYRDDIPSLVEQAEAFADTVGMDVHLKHDFIDKALSEISSGSDENTLLYRHQGERGKGIWEDSG